MKFQKVIALGTMVVMFAGMTLNVSAAPSSVDKYVNQLKKSGQIGQILNVEAYREAYSDLDEAFGDDWDAYIKHYLTAGVYERRMKGVLFDPLIYAEGYSDIKDAFGDDVLAVISHYVSYGIEENRTVGTAVGYEDIAAAVESGAVKNTVKAEGNSAVINEGRASGTAYETGDSQPGNGAAVPVASGGQVGGSSVQIEYWRTTSIYDDDRVTLLRVEYYDRNNNLIFYSEVTDYDSATKSYTENIYSHDMELVRTDTYVNGTVTATK